MPTISEEMVPPFIALTQGGLADYEGVDWSAVEPHIAHQRELGERDGRLRLRARGAQRSSCSAAARSRAGAATSTCC